eukprot:scaffold15401_cov98-Isochrysis_galbana.AAC.7
MRAGRSARADLAVFHRVQRDALWRLLSELAEPAAPHILIPGGGRRGDAGHRDGRGAVRCSRPGACGRGIRRRAAAAALTNCTLQDGPGRFRSGQQRRRGRVPGGFSCGGCAGRGWERAHRGCRGGRCRVDPGHLRSLSLARQGMGCASGPGVASWLWRQGGVLSSLSSGVGAALAGGADRADPRLSLVPATGVRGQP